MAGKSNTTSRKRKCSEPSLEPSSQEYEQCYRSIITAMKEYDGLFGTPFIRTSRIWKEINKKLSSTNIDINILHFLKLLKIDIIRAIETLDSSFDKKGVFVCLARDILLAFDYIQPLEVKKCLFVTLDEEAKYYSIFKNRCLYCIDQPCAYKECADYSHQNTVQEKLEILMNSKQSFHKIFNMGKELIEQSLEKNNNVVANASTSSETLVLNNAMSEAGTSAEFLEVASLDGEVVCMDNDPHDKTHAAKKRRGGPSTLPKSVCFPELKTKRSKSIQQITNLGARASTSAEFLEVASLDGEVICMDDPHDKTQSAKKRQGGPRSTMSKSVCCPELKTKRSKSIQQITNLGARASTSAEFLEVASLDGEVICMDDPHDKTQSAKKRQGGPRSAMPKSVCFPELKTKRSKSIQPINNLGANASTSSRTAGFNKSEAVTSAKDLEEVSLDDKEVHMESDQHNKSHGAKKRHGRPRSSISKSFRSTDLKPQQANSGSSIESYKISVSETGKMEVGNKHQAAKPSLNIDTKSEIKAVNGENSNDTSTRNKNSKIEDVLINIVCVINHQCSNVFAMCTIKRVFPLYMLKAYPTDYLMNESFATLFSQPGFITDVFTSGTITYETKAFISVRKGSVLKEMSYDLCIQKYNLFKRILDANSIFEEQIKYQKKMFNILMREHVGLGNTTVDDTEMPNINTKSSFPNNRLPKWFKKFVRAFYASKSLNDMAQQNLIELLRSNIKQHGRLVKFVVDPKAASQKSEVIMTSSSTSNYQPDVSIEGKRPMP